MQAKRNWFDTLNQALESEGLVETFPLGVNLNYGERFDYIYDNETKYGHYVSVYRGEDGRYERPIHYDR